MIETLAVLGLSAGSLATAAMALGSAVAWDLVRRRDGKHPRLWRRAETLGLVQVGPGRWLVPVRGTDALLCLATHTTGTEACLVAEARTGRLRVRPRHDLAERNLPDPALADWLVAAGPPEDLAALTGEVRAAMAATRHGGDVVVSRGIVGLFLLRAGPGFERLEDCIQAFGRLLAALERVPQDPAERLARMAVHDPVPGMRYLALARLGVVYPDDEGTRCAARRLLDDPDLDVRTEAARIAQDRDRLVRLAVDPSAPAAVRSRAARALDHARALPALGEIEALLGSTDPDVRRSGVRLARERACEAEGLLLDHLGPDEVLVAAVVEALGDLGTARSLEPLRRLHAAVSSFGSLRGLVGAAIERIRTREAERHGSLSLAAARHGELALVDGPGHLADAG